MTPGYYRAEFFNDAPKKSNATIMLNGVRYYPIDPVKVGDGIWVTHQARAEDECPETPRTDVR